MKTLLCIALLSIPFVVNSQTESENNISKVALSFNPLGFAQFGPTINGEFSVSKNLVLNAHLRFPSLGLLTYVVMADEDGLDEVQGGVAIGGGLIYFLGEKKSKPYVGALIGYQSPVGVYGKQETWEWSETDKTSIFMFNGGYRFRFANGFFINTGLLLGAASVNWDWKYKNPNYNPLKRGETGKSLNPFGMLEFSVGIEFKK